LFEKMNNIKLFRPASKQASSGAKGELAPLTMPIARSPRRTNQFYFFLVLMLQCLCIPVLYIQVG